MARLIITAAWSEIPHLSKEAQEALLASIPEYQRDARVKGIPQLGAGAIYPVDEAMVTCDPFPIPDHWPRAFALDVGWNRTAAIWGAEDRETGMRYLYSEHYMGEEKPAIHAEAIRGRGAWIPGRIDPASRGRSQVDGQQLMAQYIEMGVPLDAAPNAVESGIYEVLTLLTGGRLKVFKTCTNWFSEFRLYRRDEKGRVVKKRDHLMDATRYLNLGGTNWWKSVPGPKKVATGGTPTGRRLSWMR